MSQKIMRENHHVLFKLENGTVWKYAPVGSGYIEFYNPDREVVFMITGRTMYAGTGMQNIEWQWKITICGDVSTQYCIDFLTDNHGGNLEPPLPVGAVSNFQLTLVSEKLFSIE